MRSKIKPANRSIHFLTQACCLMAFPSPLLTLWFQSYDNDTIGNQCVPTHNHSAHVVPTRSRNLHGFDVSALKIGKKNARPLASEAETEDEPKQHKDNVSEMSHSRHSSRYSAIGLPLRLPISCSLPPSPPLPPLYHWDAAMQHGVVFFEPPSFLPLVLLSICYRTRLRPITSVTVSHVMATS